MPLTIAQCQQFRRWFILVRSFPQKPSAAKCIGRFARRVLELEPDFFVDNTHLIEPTTQPNDLFLGFVAWLVWKRRMVEAATCLWSEEQFSAEPSTAKRIWKTCNESRYCGFIGGSGLGKSYTPATWLLLDWISDPWGTRVDLVSTDEQKLKGALYAKIVNLHKSSSVILPGVASAETLSLDNKTGFGFFLQLIQRGAQSSGELKGAHISARSEPHRFYGKFTRRRVMLDEAEEIPVNVWGQIPNVFASSDGSIDSVKVFCTANPKNQNSLFGQHCQPVGGWGALAPDAMEWKSAKGLTVIRLDVRDTENVKEKRVLFAGMQTLVGYQSLLESCGGDENHADMWTFAYGMFPPNGPLSTLIPQRWMTSAEGEWVFNHLPINFAGFDTALESDTPALAVGRAGMAVKWKNFAGVEIALNEPRFAVQLDAVLALSHGDTQEVADEVMERCRALGIEAENLAIDITGMPGVGDLLRRQWNRKVLGYKSGDQRADELAAVIRVNYSEKASNMKIADEDSKMPSEIYDRMATELWYALSRYFEMDLIRMGRQVSAKTLTQMGTRRGGFSQTRGGRMTIEPKKVHKSRLSGESCDLADGVTLLLHAARTRCTAFRPKASGTVEERANHSGLPMTWTDPYTGELRGWNLASPSSGKFNGSVGVARIEGYVGPARIEDIKEESEEEATDHQTLDW